MKKEEEGNKVKQNFGKWYFGWNIVAVSMVITLLTVGLRMGIGPFVKPMSDDLGLTRTSFSLIVAVGMLVYGLGMPLAGYLLNRFSTRFVLLAGVIIINVSVIWTVMATDTLGFLLSYGVLLSIGLAFTSPVTMTPIISQWFSAARGKALFFLATGSMAGIAVITPLATFLIEQMGWQNTLIFFALLFIVLIVPSALFIMREYVPAEDDQEQNIGSQILNQAKPPQIISWKEAIKTGPFWQIVIGLFVCGFSMNLLGSHGVPMLTDHGFDPHMASLGIGFIGLVAIGSTVVLGTLADRVARRKILFWVYFIRGLGFLGLVFVATPWQLLLVAATGGLVWAGSNAMSSAILGDLYGVRLLGVLYGWSYFGHQIGAAVGSFLGGWGYERFGTHVFAFGITAVLLILASWVSLRIPEKLSWASVVRLESSDKTAGMKF
jgi:MFS family permease